ncbi:MAG: hypothetical protein ACTS1Z_10870 [Parasphingopyxis sp.]|uniref:hypothetical protein n=1 Tax=Parasphingopyxis sp. TaxID=1920299 RepID=UPI003FA0FDC0
MNQERERKAVETTLAVFTPDRRYTAFSAVLNVIPGAAVGAILGVEFSRSSVGNDIGSFFAIGGASFLVLGFAFLLFNVGNSISNKPDRRNFLYLIFVLFYAIFLSWILELIIGQGWKFAAVMIVWWLFNSVYAVISLLMNRIEKGADVS